MPRAPPPGFFVLTAIAIFVWYMLWSRSHWDQPSAQLNRIPKWNLKQDHAETTVAVPTTSLGVGNEEVIMDKLGNETLKAELGRAAWKLFHTTMARFPDKPTEDESTALRDYIHLFARLYPCGDCARHFQQILKKYPPQTSSRSTAAAWACFVHNEVNISKGKAIFDCANIGDWYDCGCADEEKEKLAAAGAQSEHVANGGEPVEIQKEGLMNGG